jgi:phosphomannomutase
MQTLLEQLGCQVVPLNIEPTGIFAHTPEPVPENLGDLCTLVRTSNADFGIAVDPDVDRCVLIDESGKPLGEEVYGYCGALVLVIQCSVDDVVVGWCPVSDSTRWHWRWTSSWGPNVARYVM